MTYIILAAGKGINLRPLTLKHPKSSYKLDSGITVLQSTIRSIRRIDTDAEIVVVLGFMANQIKQDILPENIKVVLNPFFSVTSSIASLWFAREYLQRENVTILNGDVVFSENVFKDIICAHTDIPYVLVDSSISGAGKYNVQTQGKRVCVMSKNLTEYFAVYSSVTKLDAISSRFLFEEIVEMVVEEMYSLFYEDALVQMIFERNFDLYYKDIKGLEWVEVDSVDDLLKAREIHLHDLLNRK